MKVVLELATTINGFIGLPNGQSDWVSEEYKEFTENIKKAGVIVMGKNTYDVNKEVFPFDNALNIVMTKDKSLHEETDTYIFTDKTPQELVNFIEAKGFRELLLIGGRELATSFLTENLIDEIKLDIHPLLFCDGMEIFRKDLNTNMYKLKLLGTKNLGEDIVQLHYKFIKE